MILAAAAIRDARSLGVNDLEFRLHDYSLIGSGDVQRLHVTWVANYAGRKYGESVPVAGDLAGAFAACAARAQRWVNGVRSGEVSP